MMVTVETPTFIGQSIILYHKQKGKIFVNSPLRTFNTYKEFCKFIAEEFYRFHGLVLDHEKMSFLSFIKEESRSAVFNQFHPSFSDCSCCGLTIMMPR
jgi:hypothetical protein